MKTIQPKVGPASGPAVATLSFHFGVSSSCQLFGASALADNFFIVADAADQQPSGPDEVLPVSEQIRNLLVGVAGFPLFQIPLLFPVKEDERVGDVQHVGSNRISLKLGLGDLESPSGRLPVELNGDSIFRGEDLNRFVKSCAIF